MSADDTRDIAIETKANVVHLTKAVESMDKKLDELMALVERGKGGWTVLQFAYPPTAAAAVWILGYVSQAGFSLPLPR